MINMTRNYTDPNSVILVEHDYNWSRELEFVVTVPEGIHPNRLIKVIPPAHLGSPFDLCVPGNVTSGMCV